MLQLYFPSCCWKVMVEHLKTNYWLLPLLERRFPFNIIGYAGFANYTIYFKNNEQDMASHRKCRVQGHGQKRPTTNSSAPLTAPRCYHLVTGLYAGEKRMLLKVNTSNTFYSRKQIVVQCYADLLKMSKMMLRMLTFVDLSLLCFICGPFML